MPHNSSPEAERDAPTVGNVISSWMRAALRLLSRGAFEIPASDPVWPVLRDYPYGRPAR